MKSNTILAGVMAVCCLMPTAMGQSVSSDGETYRTPDRMEQYDWAANVTMTNLGEVTIPYDGNSEWEVDDPAYCSQACGAFMGCEAFLFSEPLVRNKRPTCRMLTGLTDLEVASGRHLYIRK